MCKEEDTSIAVNNKLTLFKNGEKFKVFPKKNFYSLIKQLGTKLISELKLNEG